MLEYGVLGPLEARDGSQPLPLGGPKQRSVLALLVLEAGRVVSVDRLVEGVWGEDPPAGAGRSLQVYVSNLRKVLEPVPGEQSVLVGRAPGYVLLADDAHVDARRHAALVDEARAALVAGRHGDARRLLTEAAGLWRGEPLADLVFAPFAAPAVARLGEARADAAEDLVEAEVACGRHAEVLGVCESMVGEMPLRERRWGLLMLAQYRSGRQADALRTYARARDTLVDELGIDPGPALRDLESRILLQDPSLGGPAAAGAPAEGGRIELPRATTSIVGRQREVADVAAVLEDPATRCVTLTGPGGVGKTRLSLEVAPAVVGAFPGGAVHVALAAVDDPALVVPLIGRALGAAEPSDGAWPGAIAERVGATRTLVVLDNLEQLQGAAVPLAGLLSAAPGLVLLATSRTPLRIGGEREVPVAPLALPRGDEAVDELVHVPAVALFLERARARAADVDLSPASARALAGICARLDGLPLALELAAARARVLGPEQLLARLDDSLALLVGGGRDLPDRQRTLRATLEWSLDLLTPEHRDLLARLGVFAGSFTVEAAEAICGDGLCADVLDGLGALVDSSLVRPLDAAGGALRFGLLQTVRDLARERLEETGDAGALRDRHAAVVVRSAEEARAQVDGPGAAVASALLRADEANHRAAMEHLLATGAGEAAARLAVALRPHWVSRGLFGDGRRWLGAVLVAPGLPTTWRARASVAAGILAYYQDDLDEAVALLDAGLEAAGGRGAAADPESAALALCFLGSSRLARGEVEQVGQCAAEALALAEANGAYEPHALALSLSAMAAAVGEDYDEEVRLHEARLEVVRRRGDRERVADTLNTLAEIALDDGDARRARRLAEEAVDMVAPDARLTRRDLRLTLARAALVEGAPDAAVAHLRVAVPLCVDLAQPYETAQCLRAVAAVAGTAGRHDDAARLSGAASALERSDDDGEGFPCPADLEVGRDAARAALSDGAFAAAERAGSLLGLADAVAAACGVLEEVSAGASARSSVS